MNKAGTKYLLIGWILMIQFMVLAQENTYVVRGIVRDSSTQAPLSATAIQWITADKSGLTDSSGRFSFSEISPGQHRVKFSYLGKDPLVMTFELGASDLEITVFMQNAVHLIQEVTVTDDQVRSTGLRRLRQVEGFAIYASKKNEVIDLDQMTINKAANRSRQVYAKVSGLNIWESDGAGVQLGIGGRGLSPSRNSNFNTRQNGYDISADALGYPESYYTPPIEAIERIEIVRGAASLQYGTQFGGMLNFKFKEGPRNKKFQFITRQTLGSFGFINSFNSLGGTLGRVNYYGFYQYKGSKGWRPNESLDQHTAFFSTEILIGDKFKIRPEYTHTQYLAQQPGGLTDAQFDQDPRQSNRKRNWFSVHWNLLALNFDAELSPRVRLNSRFFGLMAGRDALGNLDPINLFDFGENRDLLSDRFRNVGNETRFLLRYNTGSVPSTFLLGTRYYLGNTTRKQGEADNGHDPRFTYLNPDNLEGSDFLLPSSNLAFFAENIFSINAQWNITPGIRFEHIRTEADGYYQIINKDLAGNILLEERINEFKKDPRSFIFGGIGSSYRLGDQEIYVNFSQNYRAINFNDIRVNTGSLRVDENLRDERGFNLDFGLRGKFKDIFEYDISLYHLYYSDRIGTILKKEPNPVFNNLVDRIIRYRTNIADARIYGIESLLECNLTNWLTPGSKVDLALFANLSMTDAKYHSSEISGQDGKKVELVPPFMIKGGLYGQVKNFGFNLQFSQTGMHFSDASNAVFTPSAIEGVIPAYKVVDFSLQYTWKKMQIESSINNLFDEAYFTRRATGYPGPGIIPSQGRSLYITLGVTL